MLLLASHYKCSLQVLNFKLTRNRKSNSAISFGAHSVREIFFFFFAFAHFRRAKSTQLGAGYQRVRSFAYLNYVRLSGELRRPATFATDFRLPLQTALHCLQSVSSVLTCASCAVGTDRKWPLMRPLAARSFESSLGPDRGHCHCLCRRRRRRVDPLSLSSKQCETDKRLLLFVVAHSTNYLAQANFRWAPISPARIQRANERDATH